MSKIKLLYDVFSTMKDKESVSGIIKVEGSRDQAKIFGLNNEFEKNLSDGRTKAKICLEVDCEGKKVKHESSTEFDLSHCHGHRRHGFMHRTGFHHGHGPMGECGGTKRGGCKDKLSRAAMLLNLLNSLKVEEQPDKSKILALNFDEMPGGIKSLIQEKMQRHQHLPHDHGFHRVCGEYVALEDPKGELNILINKNNEVEKILLTVTGEHKKEQQVHSMKLEAELSLNW